MFFHGYFLCYLQKGDCLHIRASGTDEDIESTKAYSQAVIEACRQSGCHCALCDERELVYKLNLIDTYQLAEYVSSLAPKMGKAALLINPEQIRDASFFEDVVVNRNLKVRIFQAEAEALKWLGIRANKCVSE